MTRKHTSATDVETPIKVVLVTLDNHVNGAIARAEKRLTHDLPGIDFTSFAATEWEADPQSLSDCRPPSLRVTLSLSPCVHGAAYKGDFRCIGSTPGLL